MTLNSDRKSQSAVFISSGGPRQLVNIKLSQSAVLNLFCRCLQLYYLTARSFVVFGDEGGQQVSVWRCRVRSRQLQETADWRRAKEEVVTESHQTGSKPVQSHGLWGETQWDSFRIKHLNLINTQEHSFKIKPWTDTLIWWPDRNAGATQHVQTFVDSADLNMKHSSARAVFINRKRGKCCFTHKCRENELTSVKLVGGSTDISQTVERLKTFTYIQINLIS